MLSWICFIKIVLYDFDAQQIQQYVFTWKINNIKNNRNRWNWNEIQEQILNTHSLRGAVWDITISSTKWKFFLRNGKYLYEMEIIFHFVHIELLFRWISISYFSFRWISISYFSFRWISISLNFHFVEFPFCCSLVFWHQVRWANSAVSVIGRINFSHFLFCQKKCYNLQRNENDSKRQRIKEKEPIFTQFV